MAPSDQVSATITIDEASAGDWDIVVIGAGPAGALAAGQSAALGCRVLLVDRAVFPRQKVCGCCLNGAAISVLDQSGLGGLIEDCEAIPLEQVHVSAGQASASLTLRHGVSLSRDRMDCALIKAAISQGVEFLDGAQAQVLAKRLKQQCVRLKKKNAQTDITTKITIAAGGLGCRIFADGSQESREVAKNSRVGAGAILEESPEAYQRGSIYMNCHASGYVGLVRLEDDRLDIAAALDAGAIKRHGGTSSLVSEILDGSSMPIPPNLQAAVWHGTPRLTQRRLDVAVDGCFFVGDAAGYFEPFTGEGMAWALASGKAVANIAASAANSGDTASAAKAWKTLHQGMIVRRSRTCKLLSKSLRYPALPRLALPLLSRFPWIARPVLDALNAPFGHGLEAGSEPPPRT